MPNVKKHQNNCGPLALSWLLNQPLEIIEDKIRALRGWSRRRAVKVTRVGEMAQVTKKLGYCCVINTMRKLEGRRKSFAYWREWYCASKCFYMVRWGDHFVAVRGEVFRSNLVTQELDLAIEKYGNRIVSHFLEITKPKKKLVVRRRSEL